MVKKAFRPSRKTRVESEDDDYLRDHPVSGLAEQMGILLDMDGNGDINLTHAINNLANYVEDGTVTQEEADMYTVIIKGALEQDGADYKGDGSVMISDIITYLEANYYYFDWQGEWTQDTSNFE